MLVFEAVITVDIILLVVGGLCFVVFLDRSGRRARFNPLVWGCTIFGFGLVGLAIAWTTSALS